ncbi:SDR family NAD(P)-dependent oxidoreductase [Streptosporangium subroseum]|uniref:SDR family NAD(P)-dependent oxidoreductase n=1 Tax=Streptosporangium subroseum TaxID=106412 RepID=UPI00343F8418
MTARADLARRTRQRVSEVEALFQLNAFGPLRVVQGVLPAMRERGAGRPAFVSSVQGRLVVPIIGLYTASRWAMEAFAETLAVEAGHFGTEVSILQPSVSLCFSPPVTKA